MLMHELKRERERCRDSVRVDFYLRLYFTVFSLIIHLRKRRNFYKVLKLKNKREVTVYYLVNGYYNLAVGYLQVCSLSLTLGD